MVLACFYAVFVFFLLIFLFFLLIFLFFAFSAAKRAEASSKDNELAELNRRNQKLQAAFQELKATNDQLKQASKAIGEQTQAPVRVQEDSGLKVRRKGGKVGSESEEKEGNDRGFGCLHGCSFRSFSFILFVFVLLVFCFLLVFHSFCSFFIFSPHALCPRSVLITYLLSCLRTSSRLLRLRSRCSRAPFITR